MYSNGYVRKYGNSYIIGFTQEESRINLLYLLRKCFGSEDRKLIKEFKFNNNVIYHLRISNKELGKDLINLGCLPNKSLILQFPLFDFGLMPHFIRGLFDGDGCIWEGKRHYINRISSRTSKVSKRIIHNVKFTYTGTFKFVNALQDYLIFVLGLSKTKLNFSKANNKNNHTSSCICTLEYSGRRNIEKFYHYLYDNAHYFEETKKEKFEKILCFY